MVNIEERRSFILKRRNDPLLGKNIKNYITEFYKKLSGAPFQNLFSLVESETSDIPQFFHEDNDILTTDIKEKEVHEAIMQMENNKALGPKGFHAELLSEILGHY
jgi:hypothetical protein